MPHQSRRSSISRQRVALQVESLEQRTLLNGASVGDPTKSLRGIQEVSIQVPSPYLSQQASVLPVTLVRAPAPGHGRVRGPLTVDFSASVGMLPGSTVTAPDTPGEQFTPINESVTFLDGQTTTTVDVPVHSGAPNPGLVPIALSVGSQPRTVAGTTTTVYLAAGPDDVPPFILYVHMINRGIAITFSKPMAPSTVTNVRNFAVNYSPSHKFSLADLEGVGLIQRLNTASQAIALKRAVYDPTTNTVVLIPKVSLSSSSGTFKISSPSSLASKRTNPYRAQPLTDLQGNAINRDGAVSGKFSITISRGHPYVETRPQFIGGS
jgi:hypothetical protein